MVVEVDLQLLEAAPDLIAEPFVAVAQAPHHPQRGEVAERHQHEAHQQTDDQQEVGVGDQWLGRRAPRVMRAIVAVGSDMHRALPTQIAIAGLRRTLADRKVTLQGRLALAANCAFGLCQPDQSNAAIRQIYDSHQCLLFCVYADRR